MKTLASILLLLASGTGQAAPKRNPITCEDIAALHEKTVSNKMAGPYSPSRIEEHPGSWGAIPAPLQSLPKGAKFCGSAVAFWADKSRPGAVTAYYVSALWDKEIADFYAPIAAKMGCTLVPMDTSEDTYTTHSRTTMKCPKHVAYTIAAPQETFISISVSAY
ncbi:MAG TPA: hypothetical protein VNO55_00570 [Polyangia bacterium]|nr:hypothetical protein [Polyangia bacterium]